MLAIQGELDSAVTHLQKALDLNPGERVRIVFYKVQDTHAICVATVGLGIGAFFFS